MASCGCVGSDAAAQRQDSMSEDYATGKVNFYLQYFFPPSSVGETGRTGGMPGRREVGHGMLAQRALAPIVPDEVKLLLHVRLMFWEGRARSETSAVYLHIISSLVRII